MRRSTHDAGRRGSFRLVPCTPGSMGECARCAKICAQRCTQVRRLLSRLVHAHVRCAPTTRRDETNARTGVCTLRHDATKFVEWRSGAPENGPVSGVSAAWYPRPALAAFGWRASPCGHMGGHGRASALVGSTAAHVGGAGGVRAARAGRCRWPLRPGARRTDRNAQGASGRRNNVTRVIGSRFRYKTKNEKSYPWRACVPRRAPKRKPHMS